jgi:outer membrane murein-binding lipoprotein Lpp
MEELNKKLDLLTSKVNNMDGLNTKLDLLTGVVKNINDKVDIISTDVSVLKNDVSILKTDVSVLKTDVSVLKTDVSVLKTDVSVLKTDVKSLNDWRKKLATATEEIMNKKIDSILDEHCKSYSVERVYIDNFTDNNNKNILTDFDGSWIISSKTIMPKRSHSAKERKLLASSSSALKNNSSMSNAVNYLLISETKLTIDKRHIDNKLKQLFNIKNIIKTSSNQKIEVLPTNIITVFTCDSMSNNICVYIDKINSGFENEADYKNITFGLLKTDRTYLEFISLYNTVKIKDSIFSTKTKLIISNYDDLKKLLSNIESFDMQDIKDIDKDNINKMKSVIPYLNDSTIPYNDLLPIFNNFKEKCGYITLNRAKIPPIYSEA